MSRFKKMMYQKSVMFEIRMQIYSKNKYPFIFFEQMCIRRIARIFSERLVRKKIANLRPVFCGYLPKNRS